jgi:hypothetical protein
MALINDSQIYYINSNDRINGTASDFTVNLVIDPTREYNRVCVLQALIPQSYWLIESDYNTFTLIENETSVIVSITPGNYNRKSLSLVLSTILSSTSPNGWKYVVSYPNAGSEADTGFYTYTVSGNGSSQPSFQFESYCYEPLGFDANSTNIFVNNVLTSTNVIKLSPEDQLFIHSDICSNKNDDILQDIYAGGAATYSSILYQCIDVEAYSKSFVNAGCSSYRFYLTDENETILDLNGQNMVITLVLYKKNTVWAMLPDFLKYILLGK